MANLLGQNIGTNYKGILSLDSTINTPLDATLRAVTDGDGNASGLKLSTTDSSFSGKLGVGTDAPSALLNVQNSINGTLLARFKDNISAATYLDIKTDPTLTDYTSLYFGNDRRIMSKQGGALFLSCSDTINFVDGLQSKMKITTTEFQIGIISGARLGIKGSGTTSATTSLLVQNSAGTAALTVKDDLQVAFSGIVTFDNNLTLNGANGTSSLNNLRFIVPGATKSFVINADYSFANQASALLEVQSTTKGFLPPRMTTTQKNAIATPASGLIVYDSTTNKLTCYNGTTWNDLF